MEKGKATKPKATRIIGIDFGLKRIGIAISDENKMIASPLITITCEKKSDETVKKLIEELERHQEANHYEIEKIVIGLPLMMSGKVGLLADEVHHFIALLKTHLLIPIESWDERLTTVQAERLLRESKMTRKKRSQYIDKVAAVIILQNYLQYKNQRL